VFALRISYADTFQSDGWDALEAGGDGGVVSGAEVAQS